VLTRVLVIAGLMCMAAGASVADDHADTPAQATWIAPGVTGMVGQIELDTDTDWFRFAAPPSLVVTIQVNNVTLWDNAFSLQAFADGGALRDTNSVFSPSPSRIVWTNTGGARDFYLGVSGMFQFTTGSYSVAISTNTADADGDGMSDGWEAAFLGTTSGSGTNDPDADGMSNLDEYRSGTLPNAASSVLRITNLVRAASQAEVQWPGVAWATYRIESTTNLRGGVWAVVDWAEQGGSPGPMSVFDPAPTNAVRHYRVLFE
jgi:hypothetical protein